MLLPAHPAGGRRLGFLGQVPVLAEKAVEGARLVEYGLDVIAVFRILGVGELGIARRRRGRADPIRNAVRAMGKVVSLTTVIFLNPALSMLNRYSCFPRATPSHSPHTSSFNAACENSPSATKSVRASLPPGRKQLRPRSLSRFHRPHGGQA